MKKTEHYQLNQWEASDRIRMEDFNADNQRLEAALLEKPGRMELISTFSSGNGSFMLSAPILFAPKVDWNQFARVIFFQDFHKTKFKNDEFIHIGLNLDGVIYQEKLIIPAGSFMVVCFPNHNAEGMIRLVIIGKGTGTFFLDRKYDDLRFINSVLYNSQGNPPAETRFVEPVAYVYGIR